MNNGMKKGDFLGKVLKKLKEEWIKKIILK